VTAILVVDDDNTFRSTLTRELEASGLVVRSVASVSAALDALAEFRPEIVLTDLRMSERDGIDLLVEMRKRAIDARPILMSAYATARDHEAATDLGAVRVLNKPFTPTDLAEAIDQALDCRVGFRGSVHGLSLVDLLQMFHYSKRTITIEVGGERPGRVHVTDGEVCHAKQGYLQGEEALRSILSSQSGSLQTRPGREITRTITRRFDSLLLDLLRQLDETSEPSDEIDIVFDIDDAPDNPRATALPTTTEQPNKKEEQAMGKIDDSCKEVVGKVDGAVACGVVDLDTGMLLGIYNSAQYTQTLNEIVAGATMDLFRGSSVGKVEQLVRQHRGIPENGESYFEEIHISSRNNYHFMKTIRGGKAVIVLLTKKTTSIGMGWAQVKSIIPEIEPHVP